MPKPSGGVASWIWAVTPACGPTIAAGVRARGPVGATARGDPLAAALAEWRITARRPPIADDALRRTSRWQRVGRMAIPWTRQLDAIGAAALLLRHRGWRAPHLLRRLWSEPGLRGTVPTDATAEQTHLERAGAASKRLLGNWGDRPRLQYPLAAGQPKAARWRTHGGKPCRGANAVVVRPIASQVGRPYAKRPQAGWPRAGRPRAEALLGRRVRVMLPLRHLRHPMVALGPGLLLLRRGARLS
mmetsp:Transcript_30338/g.91840  ORF Transcript_30338/g.91840 Transcript_30338/m.91840 type:complete len:244 (-) Transcript_30338:491-1222(-)